MARPHIDFIQSQVLPWQRDLYGGGRPGVETRILSLDTETGASSLLIRYPAGWSRAGPEHLEADEEFFVLDGAIQINGTRYAEKCYAHFPEGYLRTAAASKDGAVVLTFFSAEPHPTASDKPSSRYDAKRLVEHIDVLAAGLSKDFSKLGNASSPGVKASANRILREDPYDHEQTWILCSSPLFRGGVVETHPVVEELFLVSGEKASNTGLLQQGAYFWRPPGIPHGPFGSKTGAVNFFRTKGGPLETEYVGGEENFTWTPEHRPVLPPELQEQGREPWPRTYCF